MTYWLSQLDRPVALRNSLTQDALIALAPASIPGLCQRLTARDGPVRNILLEFSRVFPRLTIPMASAEDRRQAAAEILNLLPEPPRAAAQALTRGLRLVASDSGADRAIRAALERLGTPSVPAVLPLVLDPSPEISRRALLALEGILRRDQVPLEWTSDLAASVSNRLVSTNESTLVLSAAILGHLDQSAVVALPLLLPHLNHASRDVRSRTAQAMGEVASRPDLCVPALAGALDDPEPTVRASAARALGRFGPHSEAAVPQLVAATASAETPVAVAAMVSLGKIGPAAFAAVSTLKAALDRPEPIVRASAATALGRIRSIPAIAIPALRQALGDEDSYVRRNAVRALGEFGPEAKPAIRALIVALRDPVESVQAGAAEALGHIGPSAADAVPSLVAARNNNQSVMTRPVVEALARIEGRSTPLSATVAPPAGLPAPQAQAESPR